MPFWLKCITLFSLVVYHDPCNDSAFASPWRRFPCRLNRSGFNSFRWITGWDFSLPRLLGTGQELFNSSGSSHYYPFGCQFRTELRLVMRFFRWYSMNFHCSKYSLSINGFLLRLASLCLTILALENLSNVRSSVQNTYFLLPDLCQYLVIIQVKPLFECLLFAQEISML